MPFDLEIPIESINKTKRVEIASHTVSSTRNELHIGYQAGDVVDGVFIPDGGVKLASFEPAELVAAITNANVYANAMPVGEVDVHAALKLALYDALKDRLALAGAVS